MVAGNDYCSDPEKCQIGFLVKHMADALDKNNELFAKRLGRLEENIIAIREDISAFRIYQDSINEVKQSIRDINAKLENKVSYKQVTFIVTIVSVLFTILNFAINSAR